MKKTGIIFLIVAGLFCFCTSCNSSKSRIQESILFNPLPVKFGDPFVLHASDGLFYMYGTSLKDGFEVYVSDDLVTWTGCGQIYRGGTSSQWNKDCFWAPEVYERNGKFYLFYSANLRDNPTNELETFNIGVAVSDSPTGPFTDLMNRPIFQPDYPIIDANVFFDDDQGRCYLYFSRCCYKHAVESEVAEKIKLDNQNYSTVEGNKEEIQESWVYGVELKPDFSGVIGEPQLLLCPPTKIDDEQSEWESRSATNGEVNRRWTEGSFCFRYDDTYYIMYSANSYQGRYYAVGYATADNPLGPFTKSPSNPVLQENVSRGGTVMGTGHNMVFSMPNGALYTAYHGRMTANPSERVVLIDKIDIKEDGSLTVEGPTTSQQSIIIK